MRAKPLLVIGFCLSMAFCASAQDKQRRAQAKDPKYQYNVGLFHLNQNEIDEAIKYFVKALSLNTRYHLAWNALGLAHSLKGNLEESVKAFQKCLEIDPQFTEARNNLGTVYQEMNALDKAEVEFRRALEDPIYPNRELPYYNLARLYVLQDRMDEALESVQMAIRVQPRLAMAHNLQGVILEKRNELEEAIAAYEQAVRIVPDDILFNYNLGVASFKNGDYGKAKSAFLKIASRATDPEMKDAIARHLKIINERGAGPV